MIYSVPFKYRYIKKTKLAYDFSYAFSSIIDKYSIKYSRTKFVYDSVLFNKLLGYFNSSLDTEYFKALSTGTLDKIRDSVFNFHYINKNIIISKNIKSGCLFNYNESLSIISKEDKYSYTNSIIFAFHDHKNNAYSDMYNIFGKNKNDEKYSNIIKYSFGLRTNQIGDTNIYTQYSLFEEKSLMYKRYTYHMQKNDTYNLLYFNHITVNNRDSLDAYVHKNLLSSKHSIYMSINYLISIHNKDIIHDSYIGKAITFNNDSSKAGIKQKTFPMISKNELLLNSIKNILFKTKNRISYLNSIVSINSYIIRESGIEKQKYFEKSGSNTFTDYNTIMPNKDTKQSYISRYLMYTDRINDNIFISNTLTSFYRYNFNSRLNNSLKWFDKNNKDFAYHYNMLSLISSNKDTIIDYYIPLFVLGNKDISNITNVTAWFNLRSKSIYNKDGLKFSKTNSNIYYDYNNILLSTYSKNVLSSNYTRMSSKHIFDIKEFNKLSFLNKSYFNAALYNNVHMSDKLFYNVSNDTYLIPSLNKESNSLEYYNIYVTNGIKSRINSFISNNVSLVDSFNEIVLSKISSGFKNASTISESDDILRLTNTLKDMSLLDIIRSSSKTKKDLINAKSFIIVPLSKINKKIFEKDTIIKLIKNKYPISSFDDAIESKIRTYKKYNDLNTFNNDLKDEKIKVNKVQNQFDFLDDKVKYHKNNALEILRSSIPFDKDLYGFIDYYKGRIAKLYLHALVLRDNPYSKEKYLEIPSTITNVILEGKSFNTFYIPEVIYKANHDFVRYSDTINIDVDSKHLTSFNVNIPIINSKINDYRLINDIIWHNKSTDLYYYSHSLVYIPNKDINLRILDLLKSFNKENESTFIDNAFSILNFETVSTMSLFNDDSAIFKQLHDISFNYDFVFYDTDSIKELLYSKNEHLVTQEDKNLVKPDIPIFTERHDKELSINKDNITTERSNYDLLYEDNNAEHWAWVYEEEDFNFSFGVDELLLPENDIRYEDFEDLIWDRQNSVPREPVEIIDDHTFIAKLPNKYPFLDDEGNNKYEDVARQYYGVKVDNYFGIKTTVMRTVFITYYKIWQNNVFEFAKMNQLQAMTKMLDMLYKWIFEYFPEEDIPHALRVFRQIRWYGESAILNDSQYVITYQPDNLTSGALDSDTMDIPSSLGPYSTMFIDKKLHVIRVDPAFIGYDAYLELYINNPSNTTISFSVMTFTPVEVYINNESIDTITRNGVKYKYNLPYTGTTNTIRIFKKADNNLDGIFYIGNIVIENCGINGKLTIDFDNSQLIGNKILNTIAQKAISYANLIDEGGAVQIWHQLGQGNMAVSDVYDKIKEYWEIHWNQQYKGKRLTIKRT